MHFALFFSRGFDRIDELLQGTGQTIAGGVELEPGLLALIGHANQLLRRIWIFFLKGAQAVLQSMTVDDGLVTPSTV